MNLIVTKPAVFGMRIQRLAHSTIPGEKIHLSAAGSRCRPTLALEAGVDGEEQRAGMLAVQEFMTRSIKQQEAATGRGPEASGQRGLPFH